MMRIRWSGVVALAAAAACESAVTGSGDAVLSLQLVVANAGALASVDEGRVRIEGPTTRVLSVVPGTTQTIEGLLPGTYSVALEGVTAGEVETFGETTGVSVVAGRNTTVTVTMSSFVPGSLTVPASGVTNQTVNIQFGAVTGAASYRVEWATNAAFTSLRSTQTSATNATITVDTKGTNFVRVRALNRFGSVGRATANRSIDVLDPAPVVAVTPVSLSFSGEAGGPNPGSQTISISNTGGGTLSWSVSDDASWLTLAPLSGTQAGSVAVNVNTAGLTDGPWDATITVSGNATNAPLSVPVHLTLTKVVAGNPVIGVSPATLTFTAQEAGSNPAAQTLSIRNDGPGTLNWSASDNASWLTLSPTSGTNAGTVTANVNAAGLQAGTYGGVITITGNGTNSPVTVPVSLTVTQGPIIVVNPTSFSFSADQGGPSPTTTSLVITNGGSGNLAWAVTDDATWLTLVPTNGAGDGSVSLNVSSGALAAGTYNATIRVSANASNSPVNVPVTLTIAPPPAIGVSPTSLSFGGQVGGSNPPLQSVTVANTGGGTLNWTASGNANWLQVSASPAPNGGTIQVSVNNAGLTAGTYNGAITVTGNATNSPVTIPVTLTLSQGPVISASPTSFSFSGIAGGANPAGQVLTISNAGGGSLSWSASDNAPWLALSAASGTQTGTDTLTVNTAGLAAGTYNATITITGNAANSPVTVPVTLTLSTPAEFQYTCGPEPIPFQAVAGGPNPAAGGCTFFNMGGTTLNWSATDNASWLTLSPTSGSITGGNSANMSLNVNIAGLTAGTYNATFTVTGNAATLPVTVPVTLQVSPATQQSIVLDQTSVSRQLWDGLWYFDPATKTFPSSSSAVNVTASASGSITGLSGSLTRNNCTSTPTNWITAALTGSATPTTISLTWESPTSSSCTTSATATYVVQSSTPGVTPGTLPIDLSLHASRASSASTSPATGIGQTTATLQGTTDGDLHDVWFLMSKDSNTANNAGLNRKYVMGPIPSPPAYGPNSWSLPMSGLQPGTKYFFQILSEPPRKNSLARGGVLSFTTAPQQFLLTVNGAGTANGTVTSSPVGITCTLTAGMSSNDCTELYNSGTDVTLTASVAGGSTFAGWSGACTGTGPCQVTMTAASTVTATFEAPNTIFQYTCGPEPVSFVAYPGGSNPAAQVCTFFNQGGAALNWNAADNASWLTLSPTSGTIAAGNSAPLTLNVDISSLVAGTYNASFTVTGNASTLPVTVPVMLTLATPASVSIVSITANGLPVNLNNITGNFDVTVGLNTGGETVSAVAVRYSNGSQDFLVNQQTFTGIPPGTTTQLVLTVPYSVLPKGSGSVYVVATVSAPAPTTRSSVSAGIVVN